MKKRGIRTRVDLGFLLGCLAVFLCLGSSPAAPPAVPSWAQPRSSNLGAPFTYSSKDLQRRADYVIALYGMSDADKYVYGLANTLQLLLATYVRFEGRVPSLDEFLNSPYNVLSADAWANPFTGEHIGFTDFPSRGQLHYEYPSEDGMPALAVPWVPHPALRGFEVQRLVKEKGANPLGVWGTWPGIVAGPDWPTPARARAVEATCSDRYSRATTFCMVRRFEAKDYTEPEWSTYVAAEALSIMFTHIYLTFESGMPETLDEARQHYEWLYNLKFRNAFTGGLIKEVPFGIPSPGDFTYATEASGAVWVVAEFMGRGQGGRLLYPYDIGDVVTTYQNLNLNDYIRGLEGRSLCDAAREAEGPDLWEKTGKTYCVDKVFERTAPRQALMKPPAPPSAAELPPP